MDIRTRFVTGVILSLGPIGVFGSSTDAQTIRYRETGEFHWGNASVFVFATSQGYLSVLANDARNRVTVGDNPQGAKVWADSALQLVDASLAARALEEAEYWTEPLGGINRSVYLIRIMATPGSRTYLHFAGEYSVNSIRLLVTRAQARAFIAAVARAAELTKEMSPREQAAEGRIGDSPTPPSRALAPAQPTTYFLPPLPAPSDVKPYHLTAVFEVSPTGEARLIDFIPSRNAAYNQRLLDALRSLRFRPAIGEDGLPRMDTVSVHHIF